MPLSKENVLKFSRKETDYHLLLSLYCKSDQDIANFVLTGNSKYFRGRKIYKGKKAKAV